MRQRDERRLGLRLQARWVSVALLTGGVALVLGATAAAGPESRDGRRATGSEMRQLRAALVAEFPGRVAGPLLGPRYDVPEVIRFRKKEYAEAWFRLGANGKQREVDFERALPRGKWSPRIGGFLPPLPCTVRRAFERPC